MNLFMFNDCTVLDTQNFKRKFVNIFLPIVLIICFA